MSKPRITVSLTADGDFEIALNEAGRDLLVSELHRLDRRWDHFHLDHYVEPELQDATDVVLAAVPYSEGDRVLRSGKVLLRPDDWGQEYFPHVMKGG